VEGNPRPSNPGGGLIDRSQSAPADENAAIEVALATAPTGFE
jgi:hypothetical protein